MAIPVWPDSLQQCLESKSFKYEIGDTTIRSTVDVGPDKIRRRMTKSTDPYGGSVFCTEAQWETLENFFDLDCNGGATPFMFNHPITHSPIITRWKSPPSVVHVGGGTFSVDLSFEKPPQ